MDKLKEFLDCEWWLGYNIIKNNYYDNETERILIEVVDKLERDEVGYPVNSNKDITNYLKRKYKVIRVEKQVLEKDNSWKDSFNDIFKSNKVSVMWDFS